MVKGFLDIPLLLLAGSLAQTSLNFPLMLAMGLCFVALTVFPIRKSELVPQLAQPTTASS